MPRYLIESPHEPDTIACARVVQVFLATGSHFLTNAEWGCMDGVHSAWILVDVDSKEEARAILPPAFRAGARIVAVKHFTMDQIERTLRRHGAAGGPEPASG